MNKWQWTLPVVLALMGLLCSSQAPAQGDSGSTSDDATLSVAARSVAEDAAYTMHTFFQEDEARSPFIEEPAPAPMPQEPSPISREEAAEVIVTDEPSALPTVNESLDEVVLGDYGGPGEYTESEWQTSGHCNSCDSCRRRSCSHRRSFSIGGWVDQGITTTGHFPADRFNGPVTPNDREGEYQLNQLWLYAEKATDTGGRGWDFGGRIDLLYGTDHRFTMARGLEVENDLSDKWNEERFYGLAMPQLYADVAYDDLTVRMGRFFTIVGYETVNATGNFFYSHSFAMQYGEPFTHTGLLESYALTDQITLSAGFGRGWDNWEDNNEQLEFIGGGSWTSCDGASSLAVAVTSGPYDDAGRLNRSMYSVVFSHQLTDRLLWVLQHDYGLDNDGGRTLHGGIVENAEWYGISQYFVYNLDPVFDLGVRVEWFCDDDGTRVGGIGAPHGWSLGPDVGPNTPNNQVGWAGDFFEVSLGLNWKPHPNITARPECRWDWYNGPRDGQNRLPYDFGKRATQFTFGTDLIVTF